jgi:1-acyl-sn-glycerol-3-phosphate acyltransferase
MLKVLKLFYIPLNFIWFIWICIWFAFTGVMATFCYVFIFNFYKNKQKKKYTFIITKSWGNVLLLGMGVKIKKIVNRELLKDENYIIVSNHLSMVDIPVSTSVCPVTFSYLAKKEVDKIPFVGYLARNMHVYVDRKNVDSRLKSMEKMKTHLDSSSIYLFVEGTRNITKDPLLKFHNGAFSLAVETQKPIAILVLIGTDKILNPRKIFQASPGFVNAVWVDIIETKGLSNSDIPFLTELVRKKMIETLTAHKKF